MTACFVCHRVLKNSISVQAGIGPICKTRLVNVRGAGSEFSDTDLPPNLEGFVFQREGDFGTKTSVPHLVTHHSPSGFEWGYEGSGPADMALNCVEVILIRLGYKGQKTKCFDGSCFALAYEIHQDFKREFVSHLPKSGGMIRFDSAESWVKARMETRYLSLSLFDEEGAS